MSESSAKLLLIDSNVFFAKRLTDALKQEGMEVTHSTQAAYALTMLTWSWMRLPETLHPEFRRPLEVHAMGRAMLATVTDRKSLGYTLALTISFSS